jgi:hypothetical protein
MLRRLIVLIALAVVMSIAAGMTLATPALAKGPSQARITGPGLAHAIVISGGGEPGEQSQLAALAEQTNLFAVLFGPGGIVPQPSRPHNPPAKASLGARYTVVYTVPGVEPQPGQEFGRIRQEIYPHAPGGALIFTPHGQNGFGQKLRMAGWLRGGAELTTTLSHLGVLPGSHSQTAQQARHSAGTPAAVARHADSRAQGWLVALAVAIAAAALAGTALLLRHRKTAASG